MTNENSESTNRIRLHAHRQLIALAIAASHRNIPAPVETMKFIGKEIVDDWVKRAEAHPLADAATRNFLCAEFTEEVSEIIDLACKLYKGM